MKQKIALISEHASPLATLGGVDAGGQNVYVSQLSRQLVLQGYEVDVYTRWDNMKLPQVIDSPDGYRVIHIKAGPKRQLPKEELFPFMDEFTDNMLSFLEKEGTLPDLFHANFWMSSYVALKLKETLEIPFVVTFHALGKVRRKYQGKSDTFPDIRFKIEEEAVKKADQIIAECPQDRDDLIYHYRANQDKITIIPCGFDQNEFYPIDNRLARMTIGIKTNEKVILQLGRMVPRKGVGNVIKSLRYLKDKTSDPIHLLIVGGEAENPETQKSPEIKRLIQLAEKEGVRENITFVGRKNREQLKYYYSAADVFVSTPWYEPFGITPLESMACGTPVIGSNVGGIKFSVVHGKTGFLIEPKSPQKLSKKIEQIISKPSLAEMYRENAIRRVNNFFTWKTVGQSIATLYQKIINQTDKSSVTLGDHTQIIEDNFAKLSETIERTQQHLTSHLLEVSLVITNSITEGKKILLCGNGGSATDADHFAAELVGHYKANERKGLPALSLNSNGAVLTAIGNDFSFDEIFSRQVDSVGNEGDILIGISTSGNSENVYNAIRKARRKGMITIGLLGKDGGTISDICDLTLTVPSNNTQHIQELHTHLIHTMCELIEHEFVKRKTNEIHAPLFGIKYGKSSEKTLSKSKKGGEKK